MRKFALSGACAAALAFAGPALAADLPTKGPILAPAPAISWTGCYLGVHAGGIWGKSNVDIPLYPQNFDINTDSVVGGGLIGCQYQFNNIVLGIEADGSWMDLSGSHSTIGLGGTERYAVHWDRSASLRGRLGFTMGSSMFYGTLGGAWAHLASTNFIPTLGLVRTANYTGWTGGIGWENLFTCGTWRCFIGVEWLYAKYSRKNFLFLGPVSVDHATNTLRARVGLLF